MVVSCNSLFFTEVAVSWLCQDSKWINTLLNWLLLLFKMISTRFTMPRLILFWKISTIKFYFVCNSNCLTLSYYINSLLLSINFIKYKANPCILLIE